MVNFRETKIRKMHHCVMLLLLLSSVTDEVVVGLKLLVWVGVELADRLVSPISPKMNSSSEIVNHFLAFYHQVSPYIDYCSVAIFALIQVLTFVAFQLFMSDCKTKGQANPSQIKKTKF